MHNNDQISEVEKITYLQMLLTKEAKDTIAGLALTAAKYFEAIALLESRSGNKECIKSKHMDTLFSIGICVMARRVSEDTSNLDNLMNVLSDELKAREWSAPELKRSGSDTSHSHASHICQKHVGRLAIQKQEGAFFKKADATFA
uniref:Uncharacterized protein n=1 Tax=Amphimedon queenslandica TaxID=400682 RepID=A0A1X7TAB8_AMPQE